MKPDIRQIIRTTEAYNFHSHTQFCDGRDTMAAMAAGALEAGMKHYGFSPHSPIPVESGCNMRREDVPAYLAEVDRLRREYEGRVSLYAAMEIDYLDTWGPADDYFRSLPLDYRIGSVHFIPSLVNPGKEVDVDGRPSRFIEKLHSEFDDDIRYVADTFYARSLRMIEAGGFDIIGHFDKIGFNASVFAPGIEDEPWYRQHIDDMIDALRVADVVVEINTKAMLPNLDARPEDVAMHRPRLFPSPAVIKRLADAGIPLAVNSDAHFASRITAGREAALGILRQR